MELIFELIFQIVGELVVEGGFEGLGWLARRRWGRLALGVIVGFGGGVVWSTIVAPGSIPVVASAVVGVQAATVPLVAGRTIFGHRLSRSTLVDLVVIGSAVVAGRWLGWIG